MLHYLLVSFFSHFVIIGIDKYLEVLNKKLFRYSQHKKCLQSPRDLEFYCAPVSEILMQKEQLLNFYSFSKSSKIVVTRVMSFQREYKFKNVFTMGCNSTYHLLMTNI